MFVTVHSCVITDDGFVIGSVGVIGSVRGNIIVVTVVGIARLFVIVMVFWVSPYRRVNECHAICTTIASFPAISIDVHIDR